MLAITKRFINNIRLHSEAEAKKKPVQAWEIFLLALKHRFSPLEYEAYGFFRKEKKWPEMLTYLSNYEVTYKLRPSLYDKNMVLILNHKLLFNRFYSSMDLPLPQFYGFLNSDSGFCADASPLTNLNQFKKLLGNSQGKKIFIKPVGGLQGLSIFALKEVMSDNFCLDINGNKWSAEDIYAQLTKSNTFKHAGFMIEELIKQHPLLDEINATSLNTCRLLTIKRADGSIEIPTGFMRFGRMGNNVDNFAQGGIAAGIDIKTGRLKKGVIKPTYGSGSTKEHPDSHVTIEGFLLPLWDEVKSLVRTAASITPGIKSIGWDVGISKKGPILIEGNSSWSPISLQQVNGGLLTPNNIDIFKEYGLVFRG